MKSIECVCRDCRKRIGFVDADALRTGWDDVVDVEQELASMRGECTGTEGDVCEDIFNRQQLGIEKYGTTVRKQPLSHREWLQHAYHECLDQAIYLKRAIEKLDEVESRIRKVD